MLPTRKLYHQSFTFKNIQSCNPHKTAHNQENISRNYITPYLSCPNNLPNHPWNPSNYPRRPRAHPRQLASKDSKGWKQIPPSPLRRNARQSRGNALLSRERLMSKRTISALKGAYKTRARARPSCIIGKSSINFAPGLGSSCCCRCMLDKLPLSYYAARERNLLLYTCVRVYSALRGERRYSCRECYYIIFLMRAQSEH